MGTNSNREISDEVTEMPEVIQPTTDCLSSMQRKLKNTPHLLRKPYAGKSCSIFRIPESIIEVNREFYEPQIVSIGPYHHGKPHLKMIEEHKWRYLATLLNRTESILQKGLEHYLYCIKILETRARECYSQAIFLDTNEFIEMLVLDGCFIIEIFRKYEEVVQLEDNDPLLMPTIQSFFSRDFIKLENQIPFFILKELFELTHIPGETSGSNHSLASIILNFFNSTFEMSKKTIQSFTDLECEHLLDFVRSSFILNIPKESTSTPSCRLRTSILIDPISKLLCAGTSKPSCRLNTSILIDPISKLRRAGIRLKLVERDSFLEVRFSDGVIEMPRIIIDYAMGSFLVNCLAFEECCRPYNLYFTTYAVLLACLINTDKDVEYFCKRPMGENIIENFLVSDQEMVTFINNLAKDVRIDLQDNYLLYFFREVNKYYRDPSHVRRHTNWVSFKKTYFHSPWTFISAVAGFILLVLTLAQTIFSILAYLHRCDN